MYQRVKEYIQRYHMLEKEDKVVTGVSGGADSICLLFMLIELQKELGFSIVAVHVHHGLREGTADADADYVQKVCREQGVDLRIFREDVKKYAKGNKLPTEMRPLIEKYPPNAVWTGIRREWRNEDCTCPSSE